MIGTMKPIRIQKEKKRGKKEKTLTMVWNSMLPPIQVISTPVKAPKVPSVPYDKRCNEKA